MCNEEILSDVLIIDDKVLLDFSSYSNVPSISLYKNSFYKVILDEEFQGIFDNFLENNLKFENEKLDNTLLVNSSLNNFDTTLKKAINLNISKLNHFFYAEYPDLNSSMLVEMILDKKILIKSIQPKWVKIICLLLIHHSLTMQDFVRTCIKKIRSNNKKSPKIPYKK